MLRLRDARIMKLRHAFHSLDVSVRRMKRNSSQRTAGQRRVVVVPVVFNDPSHDGFVLF